MVERQKDEKLTTSRTSTPVSAGRSSRPSRGVRRRVDGHQSISSPVSRTKTSSRFAGRRSPSKNGSPFASTPSTETLVPVRRVRKSGRAGLGLDLGQPRRRAVDLEHLAARVLDHELRTATRRRPRSRGT